MVEDMHSHSQYNIQLIYITIASTGDSVDFGDISIGAPSFGGGGWHHQLEEFLYWKN